MERQGPDPHCGTCHGKGCADCWEAEAERLRVERTKYTVVLSFWKDPDPGMHLYHVYSDSPEGALQTAIASCRIGEEDVDDSLVFAGHIDALSWPGGALSATGTTDETTETPKLRESDFPSVDEILPYLLDIPRNIERLPDSREGEAYIDVRLQVMPEDKNAVSWWTVRTGDVSYDQDHRGFWGAGSVGEEYTTQDLRALAADLREQAMDHAAQCDMLDQEKD